jgi:hypothetical protein
MGDIDMPDDVVDGFSDVKEGDVASADPGTDEHAKPPLSPEERAKLEKEIKEGDQEGHHGHVPK